MSVGYGIMDTTTKGNQMESNQMMTEALELLHEDYKKDYTSDWSSARLSAYAFLFGATKSVVSKKKAKYLLEIVKEYLEEQEKTRSE
jgi:hypothetical protein